MKEKHHGHKASHHHEHAEHHKHPHGHPHHKGAGMPYFESDHWQKPVEDISVANGKYTQGEMSNPQHLKHSVDELASYAKKHKMKY